MWPFLLVSHLPGCGGCPACLCHLAPGFYSCMEAAASEWVLIASLEKGLRKRKGGCLEEGSVRGGWCVHTSKVLV